MTIARGVLLTAVVVGALGAGCARVRPWQRGDLADRRMRVSPRPLHDAAIAHALVPRQGTKPLDSSGGGGCGCD